jgi:hypothetical protein
MNTPCSLREIPSLKADSKFSSDNARPERAWTIQSREKEEGLQFEIFFVTWHQALITLITGIKRG